MNEEKKKFFENFQLRKPRLWFQYANQNRLMYNSFCPDCKQTILKLGGNINPSDLCDVCKISASSYLANIKRIIEKAGGGVSD